MLTEAPSSFTLLFNEPARLTALSIQKDGDAPQKIGRPGGRGQRPLGDCSAQLTPGSYTLSYRVVSDDSHIMSGSIKFRLREP